MQNSSDTQITNSSLPTPAKSEQDTHKNNAAIWKEYSAFHDTFTELLSYENGNHTSSDIWQLNYI